MELCPNSNLYSRNTLFGYKRWLKKVLWEWEFELVWDRMEMCQVALFNTTEFASNFKYIETKDKLQSLSISEIRIYSDSDKRIY